MTTTEEKVALDKELMAQKLVQAEREAQASLREQRAAHEEDLQRLQREKVQGRVGRALSHYLFCDLRQVILLTRPVSTSVKWDFISVLGAQRAAGRIHRELLTKHAGSQAPNLVQPW